MIALQEELDWEVYALYGLTDGPVATADPVPLALGQRAFEIALARKMKQAIHADVQREVGEILVPPKYTSADFSKSSYWRLRGKLDVPKERWISYPGAERSVDPTLVIAWAGWNHLQQAQAIAAHYERLKSDGAPDTQLTLVLASLHELIPWLLQWHNEIDPQFGERLGNFFKVFVEDESRRLQVTAENLKALARTR